MLDKYLFAILFKKIHAEIAHRGIGLSMNEVLEQTFVNARLPLDRGLQAIINSPTQPNLFVFSQNTSLDANGYVIPLSIFSRALLMMRVATEGVSVLLRSANITKGELSFFTNYFGIENGFWNYGNQIEHFEDLWIDMSDSIGDITHWLNGQHSPSSLFNLNNSKSLSLSVIQQISRASLWGITL
jgi:hypothetical protein